MGTRTDRSTGNNASEAGFLARLENRTPPTVALVVAVFAVSTSAILVSASNAPSLAKAFYRVLFTIVLLVPFLGSQNGRREFGILSGRDLLLAGLAGIALAAHFASWFESLNWTSVAASVTLVQAQPVFVATGAALLLGERVSRRMSTGIVVALFGMVVMSVGDLVAGGTLTGARPLYGDGLAVLGAAMAAVYVLVGRSVRQRVSLLPYVFVVYSACALTLLVVSLLRGVPLLGYPAHEWLLFVGMALGPGLFGHTVINWALAHVESSVVSVSLLGEPVGSTVLAFFVLSEVPTPITVLGGAVVLGGIYVTASDRPASERSSGDRRTTPEADPEDP